MLSPSLHNPLAWESPENGKGPLRKVASSPLPDLFHLKQTLIRSSGGSSPTCIIGARDTFVGLGQVDPIK